MSANTCRVFCLFKVLHYFYSVCIISVKLLLFMKELESIKYKDLSIKCKDMSLVTKFKLIHTILSLITI